MKITNQNNSCQSEYCGTYRGDRRTTCGFNSVYLTGSCVIKTRKPEMETLQRIKLWTCKLKLQQTGIFFFWYKILLKKSWIYLCTTSTTSFDFSHKNNKIYVGISFTVNRALQFARYGSIGLRLITILSLMLYQRSKFSRLTCISNFFNFARF